MKSFSATAMLWVYELKGSGRPRNVPKECLEGVWPEAPFYYLFYRTESLESILRWLEWHPEWQLTSRYSLPYEKWQDISIPQISLGSFVIRLPAGPADEPDIPDRIPIHLDPGIVFGSGLHPTTQGCLLAISGIFGSNEIHTAVDFGSGTGILAVACALAGAKSVLAIDRNPLALKISSKNAQANGVSDRIAFIEADRLGVSRYPPGPSHHEPGMAHSREVSWRRGSGGMQGGSSWPDSWKADLSRSKDSSGPIPS